MAVVFTPHVNCMKLEPPTTHQPRRKRRKTKDRKNRQVQPCDDNIFVKVFCAWGCGVSYKSLPKRTDQKAWAKSLRKLNAHESQRCPCNPHATRVSGKAKAKKRAAVDDLVHDWETVLLRNHIEILQQQIRFLRALPGGGGCPAASIAQQIRLLEGSIEHTKEFIYTITADAKIREASKLKAAKLAAEERTRLLKESSRQLSEAEGLESGLHHIWTQPTFQAKEQWLQELDKVIAMEEEERAYRTHQTDADAVGVFWTVPTEPSALERQRGLARVKAEEEVERALRLQDPADPYDEAVGVFWHDKCIDDDLQKDARYARTFRIEEIERARRVAAEHAALPSAERYRQRQRLQAIWPQFTRALRRRFPDRAVQPMSSLGRPSHVSQSLTKPRATVFAKTLFLQPPRTPPPLTQIHQSGFPSKRRRDKSFDAPGIFAKNCRLCPSAGCADVPESPSSLLLTSLEDIEPLDLDDTGGGITPPSSLFTHNDDFLNALEELLTPTPDTEEFIPDTERMILE